MGDRKLRAVALMAILGGLSILLITLLLDRTGWSPFLTMPLLVLFIMVEFRVAPYWYKKLYSSRLIDLPAALRRRYPVSSYIEGADPHPEVVLLRPPSIIGSAPDCGEALGLGYLASVLRELGRRVAILDSRLLALDTMQTIELVLGFNAPILGVNLTFESLATTTSDLLKGLRQRGYSGHIVLGGLYASVAAEFLMERMPEVDSIVRFEGEETFVELVDNVSHPEIWPKIRGLVYRGQNGQIVVNAPRSLISDLDTIPHPARDLLPTVVRRGGFAYVVSSRGCNGACAYCVQPRLASEARGNRWRGRDPQDVADEVAECVHKYGTRNISFVDDDFFGPPTGGESHAFQVAKALIERDLDITLLISVQPRDVDFKTFSLLKTAGLESTILAVDNFSQSVLDRYRKITTVEQNLRSIEILHSLDIDAYLGIIMFDPWTTLEEIVENLKIMHKIPYLRPWQILNRLEAYHGSPVTETMSEQGILRRGAFSSGYDFLDPRVASVYKALGRTLEICQTSMSEFDRFRWGSVGLDSDGELAKIYCKKHLMELNYSYNCAILDLALRIVRKQQDVERPLDPSALADEDLLKQAQDLNREALRSLRMLREDARILAERTTHY